ncbi:hypothetical protein BKN38_08720 [Helicobacter sp. CLO-3]|nr:hypothetical protein BA723_07460 [Helicobacter sp. CLO-3]OHU81589.1 hypothetical protein BKN38_08720 [Helicobacter sp. CLO-3]
MFMRACFGDFGILIFFADLHAYAFIDFIAIFTRLDSSIWRACFLFFAFGFRFKSSHHFSMRPLPAF